MERRGRLPEVAQIGQVALPDMPWSENRMSRYDHFLFVDQEKKFRGFQKLLRPETRQAVMLIEAPEDMGKTWLLNKMAYHCREPEVDLPVALVDFDHPREIHEIQDHLGLVRLIRDKVERPLYFTHLNHVINSLTYSEGGGPPSGLDILKRNIESSFSLDELRDLCLELGVEYENLPGQTRSAKSIELVTYFQRRCQLAELIDFCTQARQHIDWWHGLESFRDVGDPPASDDPVDVDVDAEDRSAPLREETDRERRHAQRQIDDAFFECLTTLMAETPVVFLFDSFEKAPPEAERWLRTQLLGRLHDGECEDAVIIVAGRKTPDLTELEMGHLLVETSLDPFSEEYIREYFEERRQISGLDWPTVVLTSGGVPGTLAIMADRALATSQKEDNFFSDL